MGPLVGLLTLALMGVHPAWAQAPDGETPAEEKACEKYKGEGARYGLCVAYCEAQDCDELLRGDESCVNLARNFIDWSVKKGYVRGPKGKETINCRVTACTLQDRKHCRGREQDCLIDGVCTAVCTSTFEGFNDEGKPLCSTANLCKGCVSEMPRTH
jgi:hypothetical protein